jgi:predicted TIM-barrel fold metal-dependent hydrolase
VSALQLCAGIPAEERYDILWGNAARFYGLES